MTYTIKEHVPGFVDARVADPLTATFSTEDDLRAVPWVASWAAEPGFVQFSRSDNALMAELHGGREFWVVGYLAPLPPWLPVWDEARALALRAKEGT